MDFANLASSFVLGLLTPLTAVCVLPLYPAFVAFLTNRLKGSSTSKKTPIIISTLITLGILIFMTLLGVIFTTLLEVSLTKVIGIISPIAFSILAIISITLIFNVDFSRFMPKLRSPTSKNPKLDSFFFGLFFGAIVIPCNPGFIAAFFTKTVAIGAGDFILNMLNFILFGIGLAAPLIILAFISSTASQKIIGWLIRHKRAINLVTGIMMLAISLYYLIFVFHIFG